MYLSPREASEKYGIHPKTLARLADKGVIESMRMPDSNHRRYLASSLEKHHYLPRGKTVLYARVSTQSQKDDLQAQLLYLQEKYPGNECISEIGSGLNFKRKKFLSLIQRVLLKEISLIVVAYPDRLVRFGFDFFEWLCNLHDCQIIVLNNSKLSPHDELMQDFMSIMHCFSSKLYFLRRYEKKIEKDYRNECTN
ncbi:MAG: IS607 family transposase [Scytonema sp. PMC 1069.18]|nr:IS607 family transposase [Scytonema sp. PMC 1069.18]MEC4881512.1 IS607 family transposase [Scytonema sp. PMC 1070.18]